VNAINELVVKGLYNIIQIYYIILFARIIMSWFMVSGGSQPLSSIYRVIFGLTEPVLAPVRKVIPSVKLGMGYLDLSPLIVLVLLRIAQQVIQRYQYF